MALFVSNSLEQYGNTSTPFKISQLMRGYWTGALIS